ncbi:MAG TPA: hypothetical protein VFV38_08925 [Ktedonobacteraceae bacterium]|nr:hypothetical protein [Ktedonobacteraceae bacterium]
METTGEGTFFEEGDRIRLKRTGETGSINATAGGVVYALMDTTNQSRIFAAYVDEDAAIELVARGGAMDEHDAIPFSEHQSERWLLARTYHARLRNGRELSVPDLTLAMTQLIDFAVPLSSQSSKSRLPERLPRKKSSNFSAPLPTWKEILPAEASVLSRAGSPLLLYGEHTWKHPQGAMETWRPNRNMRSIIYGDVCPQPEAVSGTEYAVCYLDPKRGTFSNAAWRAWFSSDTTALLAGRAESTITFLAPCVQFPYTTHYTVMEASGHVQEYTERTEAIEGFQGFPPQEVGEENDLHTVFPQFCYYHEVTCPDGVYRLEFFGPHMDEQGYPVKRAEENEKESTWEAIR